MAFVENTSVGFRCSGTVVAPDLVLTAGHCAASETTGVAYGPSGYTVYTGNVDWQLGTASAVSQVIPYPGFTPVTTPNGSTLDDGDAALLVLSTPTSAPVIQLASNPTDLALLDSGTGALIAGWGLTDPSVNLEPTVLQYGETVVQSPSYCEQEASTSGNFFDSSDQLCAIDTPSYADGVCNGDSGGPLIAAQPGSDTPIEIGLTSYTMNSCDTALPQYFTRADAIDGWVQQWIAALQPPTATTNAESSVGQSTAVLSGAATTGGAAATLYYQWGTSTAYGYTTPAQEAASSTSTQPQADLSGLAPGTTYHFRLVATSADGTAYGADESFTTAPAPVAAPLAPPAPPAPRVQAMTLADARSEARQTLHGAFHRAWAQHHVQELKCRRVSGVKFQCAVAWWHGRNDYYGNVAVWNELVSGTTEWTDHYAIRWVNNHCYFDSGRRARCKIHRHAGTF